MAMVGVHACRERRPARDIDNLDTESFLTYLPTLANGVGGFFIVEHTLIQQVNGGLDGAEAGGTEGCRGRAWAMVKSVR